MKDPHPLHLTFPPKEIPPEGSPEPKRIFPQLPWGNAIDPWDDAMGMLMTSKHQNVCIFAKKF